MRECTKKRIVRQKNSFFFKRPLFQFNDLAPSDPDDTNKGFHFRNLLREGRRCRKRDQGKMRERSPHFRITDHAVNTVRFVMIAIKTYFILNKKQDQ